MAVEFSRVRWSKLAVAGTCVELLTDRGFFAEGNGVKEGRFEREIFFGVKIVNADSGLPKPATNWLPHERRSLRES
jgi:hypothetical protein